MSKEAMKLALEALKFALHVGFDESSESQIKKGDKAVQQHQNAITALREALAEQPAIKQDLTPEQPAQQEPVTIGEPVGWHSKQYGFVYMALQPHQFEVGSTLCLKNGTPAWRIESSCSMTALISMSSLPHGTVFYTSPPAQEFVCSTGLCHYRRPLTDEEIWDEVKAADLDWQTGWSLDEDASNRYITFARAIEAAHGIKGDA